MDWFTWELQLKKISLKKKNNYCYCTSAETLHRHVTQRWIIWALTKTEEVTMSAQTEQGLHWADLNDHKALEWRLIQGWKVMLWKEKALRDSQGHIAAVKRMNMQSQPAYYRLQRHYFIHCQTGEQNPSVFKHPYDLLHYCLTVNNHLDPPLFRCLLNLLCLPLLCIKSIYTTVCEKKSISAFKQNRNLNLWLFLAALN